MVKIGHARHDENGNLVNGKAGDQTGQEVSATDWYLHKKGWILLRCTSTSRRKKIAEAAEKACKNSQIGYDQKQRNSLFDDVKAVKFDPSKTTKKVETDCSALVRTCIAYAFGKDVTGSITTVTEPNALMQTGYFKKYKSKKYCNSSDHLRRGDILCTPIKGHTAIVLNDGAKVNSSLLVVDGIWGEETTKKTQKALGLKINGKIYRQPLSNKKYLPSVKTESWKFKETKCQNGSGIIREIQRLVGVEHVDGWCGKSTIKSIQRFLRKKGYYTGIISGKMNTVTIKGWQKYINKRLQKEA